MRWQISDYCGNYTKKNAAEENVDLNGCSMKGIGEMSGLKKLSQRPRRDRLERNIRVVSRRNEPVDLTLIHSADANNTKAFKNKARTAHFGLAKTKNTTLSRNCGPFNPLLALSPTA